MIHFLSVESVVYKKKILGARKTNFTIRGVHETATHSFVARTVSELNLPIQRIKIDPNMDHLKGIPSSWNHGSCQPRILIGLDNDHLIVKQEIAKGSKSQLILTQNELGWRKCGPNDLINSHNRFSMHISLDSKDADLHEMVKESFRLESIGVSSHVASKYSIEEEKAVTLLDSTSRRIKKGWENGLQRRDENPQLPRSKAMAFS